MWHVRVVTGAWRRDPKLRVARVSSNGGLNLEFYRLVDEEADRAVRVTKDDLRVRIPMWCVGDISELTVAHGSAWLVFI